MESMQLFELSSSCRFLWLSARRIFRINRRRICMVCAVVLFLLFSLLFLGFFYKAEVGFFFFYF